MHFASKSADPTPLARLSDVKYVIPEGESTRTLFRDVNIDFFGGGLSAILGPSGSGKSSLLSILGGLTRPTTGTVIANGVELTALSEAACCQFRMAQVGFIFQDIRLLPQLNAFDNVMYPAWFRLRDHGAALRVAAANIEAVSMSHKATAMPATMSGGERQLIALARMMTSDPALVLADEPTASLDWRAAKLLLSTMRDRVAGTNKGTVIVTHDPRVVEWIDHVYHLEEGTLRYEKR